MDEGEFRAMLLTISNGLDQNTLDSLKFLCNDVGKKKLEKIKNGIELFECLIERGQIKSDDAEFLRSLLNRVHKTDLIKHIDNYVRGSTANANLLDASEQGNVTTFDIWSIKVHAQVDSGVCSRNIFELNKV